jgi:hypothetical protein
MSLAELSSIEHEIEQMGYFREAVSSPLLTISLSTSTDYHYGGRREYPDDELRRAIREFVERRVEQLHEKLKSKAIEELERFKK